MLLAASYALSHPFQREDGPGAQGRLFVTTLEVSQQLHLCRLQQAERSKCKLLVNSIFDFILGATSTNFVSRALPAGLRGGRSLQAAEDFGHLSHLHLVV